MTRLRKSGAPPFRIFLRGALFFLPMFFGLLRPAPLLAQRSQILTDRIRTLRVEARETDRKLPVISLGSDEYLHVSFDDMTHEYRRFTYRVEHCGWDWKPTEGLFSSEYLVAAADEEVIDGYEQSMNTSVPYTHYAFTLPNGRMKPVLSGNYRISIFAEGEDGEPAPVAVAFFSIVDPSVSISASVTTDTEKDRNDSSQQLSMTVNWGNLQPRDARTQLKTVVLQNGRWDNAKIAPPPSFVSGKALLWEHNRELIFPAGNEYRRFEMLSTRYPGLGMESTTWYDPYYHATLFPATPRHNYLYAEDQNGICVIRNDGTFSNSPDTESDYLLTHFRLEADPVPDADIYINGDWTHDLFTPEFRMAYNASENAYEATLFLKEGYYSYQYLAVGGTDPHTGHTGPVEGDFFQTENEYEILVYYRDMTDRYDRLVGYLSVSSRPQ